jgi:hypothetical protein
MKTCTLLKTFLKTGLLAIAIGIAISASAALRVPYTVDPDTLHLWHLDETNGLYSQDAIGTSTNGNTNAIAITLTNLAEPSPGTGPYTNAFLGSPAYTGLGTAYSATTKQHLLYGGPFPDVSQFCNPTTGAFTFEALVSINSSFATADMEIVSGDNGLGITQRGWQWRIDNGVIEWDLLGGSTDNDYKAALPASGSDAIATNVWYHIAVTYTGNSPTNNDTPNIISFYWTLLDPSRTNADLLQQFTATRPLNGSPEGATAPSLGVTGSARNTSSNPGNNEGLIGSIDEVRISDIARTSNQMAFGPGAIIKPSITKEPPANTLAPYGGALIVNAVVSASQASYVWTLNGTNVPNQTTSTLQESNITFANGGSYVLVVSNALGSVTTSVAQVIIGADATALFSTGVSDQSQVLSDVPDPHYTLIESQDASFPGPNAMVFEWNNPIEFAVNNGPYAPTNGSSIWIGDQGNSGGVFNGSAPGVYIYRTTFLLDKASPSNIVLNAKLSANGVVGFVLNGQNTGATLNPGGALYSSAFVMSNYNNTLITTTSGTTFNSQTFTNASSTPWFVPGLNTLDFVETITGGGSAILVEDPIALGQALPPGLPVILSEPVSQTVRDANITGQGSVATFSVVAVGRPPLTYQWWVNDAPVPGATNRIYQILNPTNGVGTNFFCQVFNAGGSLASTPASLTLVATNQPPIAPVYYSVVFGGMETNNLSQLLVLNDRDPDGDLLSLSFADSASTNNGSINDTGNNLIYTAPANYIGPDQYTYTIMDSLGASAVGVVKLQNLLAPTPASNTIFAGASASFNVGVTNPPAGYSFQWQLNGLNIAGATNGVLVIPSAALTDSGNYVLSVTDPVGKVWSSPAASLTVQAVQGIPGFASAVLSGGALTLNWTNGSTLQVSGSVTGPWTNVAGATSPFTISNLVAPQLFYRIEP